MSPWDYSSLQRFFVQTETDVEALVVVCILPTVHSVHFTVYPGCFETTRRNVRHYHVVKWVRQDKKPNPNPITLVSITPIHLSVLFFTRGLLRTEGQQECGVLEEKMKMFIHLECISMMRALRSRRWGGQLQLALYSIVRKDLEFIWISAWIARKMLIKSHKKSFVTPNFLHKKVKCGMLNGSSDKSFHNVEPYNEVTEMVRFYWNANLR